MDCTVFMNKFGVMKGPTSSTFAIAYLAENCYVALKLFMVWLDATLAQRQKDNII